MPFATLNSSSGDLNLKAFPDSQGISPSFFQGQTREGVDSMSNAMSMSKSRWKGALLATVAASVLTPLAAHAQSMTVGITTNPLGGGTSPNVYSGLSNVYIDPYDKDTLYVYATVTGTAAPSASYVDGLNYLYYNINGVETGTAGLGSITSAVPSTLFGGGSFNQTSGNTSPGAGAQGGAIGTLSTTPSVVVGSTTTIGSIAKPRSAGDVYVSSTTNSGSNIVVNGDSVSFLVETLTYTPNTTAVNANPSKVGAANSVAFNVSIPSVASYGPYTGANYFVGLPSTPAVGSSPGTSNTSTGYSAAATGVTLTNALVGDVNLDGTVNGVDLSLVATKFNTNNTGGYIAGDLNEDGVVNGIDFSDVATNFNTQLGPAPSGSAGPTSLVGGSVPEPASLGLLSFAAVGLLRRRRMA
jgi:hypothetical protein